MCHVWCGSTWHYLPRVPLMPRSAAVKSLLLKVSRMVSGDLLRDISFFLPVLVLWGVEVDFGTTAEFDEHAWGCCPSSAAAAHLFLRLTCFESFVPPPPFILDGLVKGPAMLGLVLFTARFRPPPCKISFDVTTVGLSWNFLCASTGSKVAALAVNPRQTHYP